MAARQLLEDSHNLWINTDYKNGQVSIELRKTATAEAALCCITPGMGSVGLTFPHGSARLFWQEYLTTPEQYTSLDNSENIMLRVKNTDEEKQLSFSRNDKLLVCVSVKRTGEIFLSFASNNSLVLPKTSLQFVVDSSCQMSRLDNVVQTSVSSVTEQDVLPQHDQMVLETSVLAEPDRKSVV